MNITVNVILSAPISTPPNVKQILYYHTNEFYAIVKMIVFIANLSKNNFKHSLNRHMPSKFVQQLGHQSRQAIEALLIKRSFFNIDWTEDQVMEALTLAYEEALNNGIASGKYSFTYLGETIVIYLENGLFKTGFGLHSYTYDELYELFLLLGGE